MVIRRLNIFFGLLVCCLGFTACPSSNCLDRTLLPYQGKFSIDPEKNTYKVGDTMIFNSEFPISGLFPEGQLPPSLEIASKITCGKVTEYLDRPASLFKSYLIKGIQYPLSHRDSLDLLDTNIANFIYERIGDKFVATIGIIPQDTGVFIFSPFSAGIKINKGEECESFSIFRIEYHNGNYNGEIAKEFYGGYPPDASTYYFRVE